MMDMDDNGQSLYRKQGPGRGGCEKISIAFVAVVKERGLIQFCLELVSYRLSIRWCPTDPLPPLSSPPIPACVRPLSLFLFPRIDKGSDDSMIIGYKFLNLSLSVLKHGVMSS
jgi:hypothetical protein